MSQNRFILDGLDDLRAQLRSLPQELANDASAIVLEEAGDAKSELVAAYERVRVTGALAEGVVLQQTPGRFKAGARVLSAAPHAALYEYGTQARHTAIGANRGAMPAKPTAVPIFQRRRRQMYARLKAMLTTHGLKAEDDGGLV